MKILVMQLQLDDFTSLEKKQKDACLKIGEIVQEAGGVAVLVGGCVRDAVWSKLFKDTPPKMTKDIDIEVFRLEPGKLLEVLQQHFQVDTVGQSFGVYKLKYLDIDVAVPRKESKRGQGHKGFAIEGSPELSFLEAAVRRDFTINAISWNVGSGEVIDPLGGLEDLRKRILKHCSAQFAEDPLRVLRAMQFIGRFELEVEAETLELCKRIHPENLSKERIFEEWKKWILGSRYPSKGLHFLRDCGWIEYYPDLKATIGCRQRPDKHPEGDVWIHTCHCMDAFASEKVGIEYEDLVVGFAVLCHDLGKPSTTEMGPDGVFRSPKHEAAGEAPTRRFLAQMTEQKELIEDIVTLVTHHMRPTELYKAQASDSAVRRLASAVGPLERLLRVCSADRGGRPPMKKGDFPEAKWLIDKAEALDLKTKAPKPLLQGRHLIERGLNPSTEFKVILDEAFEAQLSGDFHDLEGAKVWLEDYLKKDLSDQS